MKWYHVVSKIEKAVYRFLKRTIKGNALCDSRPRLCLRCKMLRFYLKFREFPNFMLINTVRGIYYWNNTKLPVLIARNE